VSGHDLPLLVSHVEREVGARRKESEDEGGHACEL
jgi:hypothetical protein